MAIHELKEQIARLPEQPGVYLYFNPDGDTIYVGKARSLRDRVRNYLGAYGGDHKNYPYLQLTTNEAFPRVLVARRVEQDGSFFAGPFLPATFARHTMSLTHRLFGIRSCNEVIT